MELKLCQVINGGYKHQAWQIHKVVARFSTKDLPFICPIVGSELTALILQFAACEHPPNHPRHRGLLARDLETMEDYAIPYHARMEISDPAYLVTRKLFRK